MHSVPNGFQIFYLATLPSFLLSAEEIILARPHTELGKTCERNHLHTYSEDNNHKLSQMEKKNLR